MKKSSKKKNITCKPNPEGITSIEDFLKPKRKLKKGVKNSGKR